MNGLSIRWRLTLWYVAALSVILLTFGATMYAMIRSYLLSRVDAELVEESGDVTGEIEFARSEEELQERLQRHFVNRANFSFQISRRDGTILIGSPWLRAHKLPTPVPASSGGIRLGEVINFDLPHSGRHRLFIRRVRGPDGPLVVHSITGLAKSDRELQSFLMMLIIGSALALAVALSGGYLIAQRAMQPINHITATAERISSNNLSERVPVSNRHDELGRLAITLNETFSRLQKTIDEIRRFTADAAHELRTPLAVIRTEAEVSLRGNGSPEHFRRVAEVAADQSMRLSTIVDQLLTLSRQDTGLHLPKHEDVALKAVVLDVVEMLRGAAERRGVELKVDRIPHAYVLGDDVALSQLFFNLLDNALKFTPPGGTVTIAGALSGDSVKVWVQDTGIGIENQFLSQIFQRFFRVNPAGDDGGTGLGLAICKSIVDAHHGTIDVESQAGAGTRFTVSFHRKDVSSAEIEISHHDAPVGVPATVS